MPTTTKNASVPEFCMSGTDEQGNNCNFCNGESEKKTSQTESAVKAQHYPPKKLCLSVQKFILNREEIKSPFEHRTCERRCCLQNFVFPVSPPSLLLRPEYGEHRWFSVSSPSPSPPFLSGKFICAMKKSVPPFGNERDY